MGETPGIVDGPVGAVKYRLVQVWPEWKMHRLKTLDYQPLQQVCRKYRRTKFKTFESSPETTFSIRR